MRISLNSIILSISLIFLSFGCSNYEPKNRVEPHIETVAPETIDNPETAEETEETEENIVWKNWYLSVPINRGDGKATSIYYEAIVNNQLSEEESEYFYKNEDGTYTMFTKFTGFTNSGLSDLGDK